MRIAAGCSYRNEHTKAALRSTITENPHSTWEHAGSVHAGAAQLLTNMEHTLAVPRASFLQQHVLSHAHTRQKEYSVPLYSGPLTRRLRPLQPGANLRVSCVRLTSGFSILAPRFTSHFSITVQPPLRCNLQQTHRLHAFHEAMHACLAVL